MSDSREKFEAWRNIDRPSLMRHMICDLSVAIINSEAIAWDAWQATRRVALEEAAQECERLSNDWHGHDGKYACEDAANKLRALAAQTGQEGK